MTRRVSVSICLIVGAALGVTGCDGEARPWWKGNLHTHSMWSDGDDYPEPIIEWYKSRGYHFVALSDHNVLATGERWIDVAASAGGAEAFDRYVQQFGGEWVDQRREDGVLFARLKTLEEYRVLFEEPDRFLVIQSEEISDRFEAKPIHVNATNVAETIAPQGGGSVREVMQRNVDAVLEQRRQTGQAMFPHINHPNYGWAVTVEDLMALEGERFFEVYNGHPLVNNQGDAARPSTERMWDIILAERLSRGDEPMYGIAVDDAHDYRDLDSDHRNPGRGWIVVRAAGLHPDSLIAAMEAGDFYASTGVELEDLTMQGDRVVLEVRAAEGVNYTTQFIGTRVGYPRPVPAENLDSGAPITREYSDDIGVVLAEVPGSSPRYTLAGDELYVRAKVISSRQKTNPNRPGEVEVAWTQPLIPGR